MTDYKECVASMEFVKISEVEYIKLIERVGKETTMKALEKLDNYKGSHGKKYKSDYRAILSWVLDALSSNGSIVDHPDQLKDIKEPTKIVAAQKQLRALGWKFKEVKVNTGTVRKWVK